MTPSPRSHAPKKKATAHHPTQSLALHKYGAHIYAPGGHLVYIVKAPRPGIYPSPSTPTHRRTDALTHTLYRIEAAETRGAREIGLACSASGCFSDVATRARCCGCEWWAWRGCTLIGKKAGRQRFYILACFCLPEGL